MKKIIILLVFSITVISVFGQRKCGSELNLQQIQQTDKVRYQQIISFEKKCRLIKEKTRTRGFLKNEKILIPVVVHIVYNTESQNISNEQILSQIDVLNEDFQRLNADTINTPTPFQPLVGKMNIQFCLARKDPYGNPTDGITRTKTSKIIFDGSNAVKFTNEGGCDSWDSNKYLNIWVCNLDSGILGYAQFPFDLQAKPATDGVVINYQCFGRIGQLHWQFNKGRTATHEVGHWLNLRHIWGDNSFCEIDDEVDDTPPQSYYNRDLPSFPVMDKCTPDYPGVMFMNYMDYTDDAGLNMFTKGQISRMLSTLDPEQGARKEILRDALYLCTDSEIEGPDDICDEAEYTIKDLPSNIPIEWIIDDSYLDIISGQGTNTIRVRAKGSTGSSISAKVYLNGRNYMFTKHEITVGASSVGMQIYDLKKYMTVASGEVGNKYILKVVEDKNHIDNNHNHFDWKIIPPEPNNDEPNNDFNFLGGKETQFQPMQVGSYQIILRHKNNCDKEFIRERYFYVSEKTNNFHILANIHSNVLDVKFIANQGITTSIYRGHSQKYTVQVWKDNQLLTSLHTNQPYCKIPLNNNKGGVYVVKAICNGKIVTEKIIKTE